jgi:acetyltransferase-like isoleucine patch superfamily enzyme
MIHGRVPSVRRIERGGIGFAHPGSLSSAACFSEIGNFDTSLRIAIDTDWLLRAFEAGFFFEYFESIAYMAEGGVSDRNFRQAMQEFFFCSNRLGLTSARYGKAACLVGPIVRKALHAYRSVLRNHFRTLKHGLLSMLIGMEAILPTHSLRSIYFSILGFQLSPRASIGKGFRFYRTGRLIIGEGSVVNRSCLFDNRGGILIGKNVSISRNVSIFTAGHDTESPFFEMITAPVEIDDHAVIFSGATIMPGVKVGAGAIVYSGAVVTKDIDPMMIVGGVPARAMGQRQTKPLYALDYPYPLAM